MGDQKWYSNKSKEDQTRQISNSVFVTNFPYHFLSRDLWKARSNYGAVIDVFIPFKKSKAGKIFAFVRFIKVVNLDRLIENLCTIWIGRLRLHANVVRFHRDPKPSVWKPKGSYYGTNTGVNVGNSRGSFASIPKKGNPVYASSEDSNPALVLDDTFGEDEGQSSDIKKQENANDDDNEERVSETRECWPIIGGGTPIPPGFTPVDKDGEKGDAQRIDNLDEHHSSNSKNKNDLGRSKGGTSQRCKNLFSKIHNGGSWYVSWKKMEEYTKNQSLNEERTQDKDLPTHVHDVESKQIILDPDDQSMWESAKTIAPTPYSAIVRPDVNDNFVINSTHLKMIWENKFDG
ncbi:RNA-directed DNA polymerase, eukaryota, nucleotide-binding alpha-beta plait domain protein [Tanacetum coccineum]